MCGDDGQAHGGGGPATVAEALRIAGLWVEYLNSPAAGDLGGAALGETLIALGQLQDRLAAAHARLLRRFDAADAHDADATALPPPGWPRGAG